MARLKNSDGQVGWIAWGSLVLIISALFVLLSQTMSNAFKNEIGVLVVTLSATIGMLTAARCRRFGIVAGMTLPSVFGMALALHWSMCSSFGWQMAGLGLGIFLALVGGRVAMQMIAVDLKSRESTIWLFIFVVLLPIVLFAGFRLGWKQIVKIPNGLELWSMRLLLIWGTVLFIWRPALFLRTIVMILCNTLYRVRIVHEDRMPDYGPVLILANHVSFLDALFIMALKARRVTLLIHSSLYRMPVLYLLFRWIGALEVPRANQPKQMKRFLRRVHKVLEHGGVVCMFPEGEVSGNGIMQDFKGTVTAMLPNRDVTVLPINMSMLWGSLFRWYNGRLRFIKPHKLPIPATVYVGTPIPPDWSSFKIWQRIGELGAEAEMPPTRGEKTVHHRFLKRAKQHPFAHTFHDYDEKKPLNNLTILIRSVILSKKFRAIMAERNDEGKNIGVMLPNKVVTVVAVMAGLLSGRRVALLNFTAGPEALQKMIDKAQLKVVVTSKMFLAKLKMEPLPGMIFLEDIAAGVTKGDKIRSILQTVLVPHPILIRLLSPENWYDVNDCAAILFSSGSTGVPKGVMLSHHNLNSNIMSFWREIAWETKDSVLGNLPLFHAFGLMTNFCFPAVTGTRVVFVPNPLDGGAVAQAVRDFKLTFMIATPTFLQSYLRSCKPEDLSSLRLVVAGAEKLQKKLFDKVKDITGLNIVEGYGCTEMSPIVSINISRSLFVLGKESGPYGSIGVPMPGIAVKVIDPDTGAELGENEPGLLYCKSPSVMMGYLDDPEATAQVITPDGYYNTKDVARVDRNGYIYIVGRLSRFSKIGGEMVPHEMVERRLEELGHLDGHVAVAGRPDERKGEQLVVMYSTEEELNIDELLQKMREAGLPNLWIPRPDCFYKIDEIPILGNGKKDLKRIQDLAKTLGTADQK